MGPKRTAIIVLAVIAAMVVLISMIAGAIAVFPREHRYAVGAQTSYAPPPSPASTPSASAAPSTATRHQRLPRANCLARSWLRPRSASFRTRQRSPTRSGRSRSRG